MSVEGDSTRVACSVDVRANHEQGRAALAQADQALGDGLADFFARLNTELSEAKSPIEGYEPSKQWMIWAIMFGILLLAVVLTL